MLDLVDLAFKRNGTWYWNEWRDVYGDPQFDPYNESFEEWLRYVDAWFGHVRQTDIYVRSRTS